MPWHDVQQGDTLMALAAEHGLESWEQILDRSENQALQERGAEPGILKPGERVFVPNKQMRHEAALVDQRHSFRVSPPAAYLRLALKDGAGEPCAGCKYTLEVGERTFEGNVAADGILEHPVPVTARAGRLSLWLDGAEEAEEAEVWELDIGAMDPPEEISGVQARLENLGYDCGDEDGASGPKTEAAIRAFQVRTGLEPTGRVDEALVRRLALYYDPDTDEKTQEVEPELASSTEDTSTEEGGAGGDPPSSTPAATVPEPSRDAA